MPATIIRLKPGEELSPEAVHLLAEAAKACKIIAFPTDTVYGLGSTGLVKAAARRIYQIKGRSSLKPLPILVSSAQEARRWVEWTPAAEALSRKFWPGALTLALRPTQEGRLLTFAEYPTVAIRVPGHPLLLKLLEASAIPWVSTSANLSGSPALTEGAEVARQFQGLADFIIDAGPVPGRESTMVDAGNTAPRILRQGVVAAEEIHKALKESSTA
ncbi:MAG: threonylcarbamoyl-AMP synthase [Elusimicrobia bacterium]|nr:threonylcarbamoyl-AMP synthase [Elusimicrobiota bacterium]